MTILIQCDSCNKTFPVPVAAVGRDIACPNCQNAIVVNRDAMAGPKSAPVLGSAATSGPQAVTAKVGASNEQNYSSASRGRIARVPISASRSPAAFWVILAASCGAIAAVVALGALYYQGAIGNAPSGPPRNESAVLDRAATETIKGHESEPARREPKSPKNNESTGARTEDLPAVISVVEPGVVTLITSEGKLGSGFVVDRDGIVATNFHVIDGASKVTAIFKSGENVESSGFCYVKPAHDLALLSLPRLPAGTPVLRLSSNLPRKGESLLSFGSPRGLTWTVAPGMASAVRTGAEVRTTFPELYGKDSRSLDDSSTWIQHSAPISNGSSGGPLTNAKGEVVGVNTLQRFEGQNLNFALSAQHVAAALSSRDRSPHSFTSMPTDVLVRAAPIKLVAPEKTLAFWRDFMRARISGSFQRKSAKPNISDLLQETQVFTQRANSIRSLDASGVDPALVLFAISSASNAEKCAALLRTAARTFPIRSRDPYDVAEFNVLLHEINVARASACPNDDSFFRDVRLALSAKYGVNFPDYDRTSASPKPHPYSPKPVDASVEQRADAALNSAKTLLEKGKVGGAIDWLKKVIADFPGTDQAAEANSLLNGLNREK